MTSTWAALSVQTRIRIGRAFAAASVGLSLAGSFTLLVLGRWDFLTETDATYFAVLGIGFGSLAWVLIPAQPRNGAVWALAWASVFGGLLVAGVAVGVVASIGAVDDLSYRTVSEMSPAKLPLAAAVGWNLRSWTVVPALWLPLTFGLLLFPDGRVLSRRWRLAAWWSIVAITIASGATAIAQHPRSSLPLSSVNDSLPGTLGSVIDGAFAAASVGAVFALISLVRRYHSSDGPTTRSQIRWIGLGGAAFLVLLIGGPELPALADSGLWTDLVGVVGFSILIVAYWIAITRHRLYEIDVIVSKSVTYLGLAAAITLLYAAVVVVPLLVIGQPEEGGPGLMLPIIATGVVAVLFEPIRSRMQRWANRLVYGQRTTPHQVLSQVTARLAETTSGSSTADLARLLVEGTGAEQAVVWLAEREGLGVAGSWSKDGSTPSAVPEDNEVSALVEVRHEANRLGAVSITKPRNDPITPADRELLDDVAAGAGLLLRNIRLNKELEDRAVEVRESRRRLIEAQDRERHRLERDLHDGAQQQVVALKVKLGIAKTVAQREEADDIAARLVGLADETQDAVDALRAVAHGIYPPLLESEGLEPALRAVERRSTIPVELNATDLQRYERSTEATIYFCVTETLERARLSGATSAQVQVAGRNGNLTTEINLDSLNTELDLRAVADRLDAAGGTLTINPQPDRGQSIQGRLPLVGIEGARP
jgi:signal transduction histidine kinase